MTSLSVEEALNKPVQDLELTKPNQNGTSNGLSSAASHSDEIQEIKSELEKTRQERDSFESQYKGLLAKLTQMRTTLGDRLRQDAVSSIAVETKRVPSSDQFLKRYVDFEKEQIMKDDEHSRPEIVQELVLLTTLSSQPLPFSLSLRRS